MQLILAKFEQNTPRKISNLDLKGGWTLDTKVNLANGAVFGVNYPPRKFYLDFSQILS